MEEVLWLSPEPPTLYSGGAKSLYNCIKMLSRIYRVTVFCMPSNLVEITNNKENLPDNVSVNIFPRISENKQLALTMSWLQDRPYKMVKNSSIILENAYEKIIHQRDISAVFIEHSYMAQFAWKTKSPRILNMQNIESSLAYSEFSIERDWKMKALWKREERCWAKWERKIASEYEQITVISDNERQKLINIIGINEAGKISVLERGTECIPRNQKINRTIKDILFVGSMAYSPNIDAVKHFAKEIFPYISRSIVGATFTIVGSNPPKDILSLSALPGINITGFVDNLDSYYERASLFVIPMRSGGGVKMKLLEALGRGMPVVTTTLGADGIKVTHDKEVMIADENEEFAKYCIELLKDKKRADKLGISAYNFALKYHSWETTGAKLIEIIDRAKYQFKNKKN